MVYVSESYPCYSKTLTLVILGGSGNDSGVIRGASDGVEGGDGQPSTPGRCGTGGL